MLHILGMGYCHPEYVVDNDFILSLGIDTTKEWILEKIGVESRRTTLPLEYIKRTQNQDTEQALKEASMTPAQMGVKAAQVALEKLGLKPTQIGLLICNCCTPSTFVPTEGQLIARELGLKGEAYEVFSACPAFALHMDYLSRFEEEQLPEYVLCISTAAMTQKVNYADRTDGAIWGDGAAAWVVSAKHSGRLRVLDTLFQADASRAKAVVADTFGFFYQDGRAVRDFSVRQTVRLIKRLEEKFELDWKKDIFIGHQANGTMLQQITNNRKISEANHWHNVRTVGNQAGAGAPAVLAEHWGELKSQQKIVVAVVGAGLSWGSVLLEVT